MSSTNRGAERRDGDAYYTPDDLAGVLVGLLPISRHTRVLEPHVGGGAFARAINNSELTGLDLNPNAEGFKHCGAVGRGVDFLTWEPNWLCAPDWVIGNPPFQGAEDHARHALSVSRHHVAFLLRLAFLESGTRIPFWREHPCRKIWVLAQRPSFTGNGKSDSCAYGFFWWDKEHTGETSLSVLDWKTP